LSWTLWAPRGINIHHNKMVTWIIYIVSLGMHRR
jgi:hypothetical protein